MVSRKVRCPRERKLLSKVTRLKMGQIAPSARILPIPMANGSSWEALHPAPMVAAKLRKRSRGVDSQPSRPPYISDEFNELPVSCNDGRAHATAFRYYRPAKA